MEQLKSKKWWSAAGVRAIKTIAQTFVSTIGVGVVVLSDVNWTAVISTAILAGFLSLCTSIAGLPEVEESK